MRALSLLARPAHRSWRASGIQMSARAGHRACRASRSDHRRAPVQRRVPLTDGWIKCAFHMLRRAKIAQDRACGSVARGSSGAAVSRDLPISASPESNTTWPSPVFAFDHRRISNSTSSSRPTRTVRSSVCSASKRPSAELPHSAAQARIGPEMPLRSFGSSPQTRRGCRVIFACRRR